MQYSGGILKGGVSMRPRGSPRSLEERRHKLVALLKQKVRLVRLLAKGAMAQGYRTELWTTQRIAALIENRMGVQFHRNHVGKLLHRIGWSHQKPESRAVERDEAAIVEWKRAVWPCVKKTPQGWQPM